MMPQYHLWMSVEKIKKDIKEEKCDIKMLATDIKQFSQLITSLRPSVTQATLPFLVIPFLELHGKRDIYKRFNEEQKICVIRTLKEILSKTRVDNEQAFYFLLDFLLTKIYDPNTPGQILDNPEELKLEILECFNTLFSSMSWDIYLKVYTEKHFPEICLILHMSINMSKNEKSRPLRLAALECIMKAVKVDDNSEEDVILYAQVAPIILKILPGLVSSMAVICVEDDKCGHQIAVACIRGWGRLVSVSMRDYRSTDEKEKAPSIEEFMQGNDKRNANSVYDEKLAVCCDLLTRLTTHSHVKVRKELAVVCKLLIETCFISLSRTIVKIIEILIILSQDEYDDVSSVANETLESVNVIITRDNYKVNIILDDLQQSFYKHLTQLPNVFNGVDPQEQIAKISLLSGYLKLFATSSKLKNVLFTQVNLNRLIGSMLLIVEIEKNISLLEEYTLHDWNSTPDQRTPWKTFKFSNKLIQDKMESACHLLVQPTVVDIVLDYLLDVFINNTDQRIETTLLINEIMSVKSDLIDHNRAKEIIELYLDPKYSNLNLAVEGKTVLRDVQRNIIQLCLQLEGLGKISLAIGHNFQLFMLKVLYFVLENAGSGHPLLRAAGLSSIANISLACGYKSVTDLINQNSDYFSHHVITKLKRLDDNESVLTVLAVVMNYSNIDVLESISNIVEGVLVQSFDKFQLKNAQAYLRVFAIFMKSMHRWLDIKIITEPIKSNQEREKERELEYERRMEELHKPVDFSDEAMGKTAEEMYKEDLEKKKEELEAECEGEADISEYKKPEPPRHIKLVILILERALNFLPAKETNRKILVLEILNLGVEILKDYEDDLLPIVHKIWSPLVNRFKEFDVPLMINLSFNLLFTLGRLSKDFIRMRTIKEVLPSIREVLLKQAKESYRKDRGSAYRYTQGYKMQLNLLNGLGRLAYDLDIGDSLSDVIGESIEVYLSNKQPIPLQEAAVSFYKTIQLYDVSLGKKLINNVSEKYKNQSDWKKNLNTLLSVT